MLRNAKSVAVVLGTVALALTGIQGAASASTPRVAATVLSASAAAVPDARLTKLVVEAKHQTTLGISYLYAGGHGARPAPLNSHVDCSGFVRELYNYAFGVDIGGGSGDGMIRTSGKFTKTNSPVPGDVVLLGNGGSAPAYHSGIYIGIVNGEPSMVGSPETGQNIKVQPSRGGTWRGDLMGFWHFRGAVAAAPAPARPHVIGSFETVTAQVGSVSVSGWVIDPQHTSSRARAQVLIDGRSVAVVGTTIARADVNQARRVSGTHGFQATIAASPGRHTVCVNALSLNSTSVAIPLTCKGIVVPTPTRGSFDRVTGAAGSFTAAGWAVDPRAATTSGIVRIASDGHVVAYVRTTVARPDVNNALRTSGTHGFQVQVRAAAGRHTVCALSLPISAGSGVTSLGCRLVGVR